MHLHCTSCSLSISHRLAPGGSLLGTTPHAPHGNSDANEHVNMQMAGVLQDTQMCTRRRRKGWLTE